MNIYTDNLTFAVWLVEEGSRACLEPAVDKKPLFIRICTTSSVVYQDICKSYFDIV
jgi:hypothetical protein